MRRRVVVVATSEVRREALGALISSDDEVHIVVPAVEQTRLEWLANDDDDARNEAERVGGTLAKAAPGDAASVDVKPDGPSLAVRDAIAEYQPDAVVLALREGEDASWLETNPSIARWIDGVPVTRLRVC
jgi:hypothetical protein